MPYEVEAPNVFGSFMQGQELRRRNALADMEQQQMAQEASRRDELQGLQARQIRTEMDDSSQDRRMAAYQRIGALAQDALKSGNPRQYVAAAVANPAYGALFGVAGIDPRNLDLNSPSFDQDLQAWASLGPQAVAEQAYTLKPGEARFVGGQQVAAVPEQPAKITPYQEESLKLQREQNAAQQAAAEATRAATGSQQNFARADKLRDEFNAASKEFVTVGDAYGKVQAAATDPSAAGDLSLIFSYMKILDPTSVVREQEFANAQNAGGVPDKIRAAYNKVLNGQRLAPNQRADFVNQAKKVYGSQKARQDKIVVGRYTKLAQDLGVDPKYVVSDLGAQEPAAPQQGGEVRVSSIEQAMSLPKGTVFFTPDGRRKVR